MWKYCYVQGRVSGDCEGGGDIDTAQQGPMTDQPMIFYELTTRRSVNDDFLWTQDARAYICTVDSINL